MRANRQAVLMAVVLAMAGWMNSLWGQEDGVAVTYRLTAFGEGGLRGASYANSRDGEFHRVSKMHVTNPITAKLRDGAFLDFFAEGVAQEAPPAFSVRVPASSVKGDLLVVLMFSTQKIKPLLLDLDALKVKGGGQYVFNMLPVAVAVQCGEGAKPVSIPAGKTGRIPPPPEQKVIQTLYYAGPSGKPTKFSSSIFFKDEETRQLVFCHAQKGRKLPRVSPISIYQQRPPDGAR